MASNLTKAVDQAHTLPLLSHGAASLMACWEIDLDLDMRVVGGALQEARDRAVKAIHTGDAKRTLDALRQPASRAAVAGMVFVVLRAVPPKTDAVPPAEMIAEEVLASKPSLIALERAKDRLIRSHTFSPSIAEFLTALAQEQALAASQAVLIERLPSRIKHIDQALAKIANRLKSPP